MTNEWKSFLESQGAVLAHDQVQDFGHAPEERRAAAQGTILADLSDSALIRARGVDVQAFLNSQFSNDLKQLDATHSQLAAWCSPKGRMLAIFRLFKRGDDYLLQLPAALQAEILKRLRMYVMRAKATLDSVDEELRAIGLSGPTAEKILATHTGFLPEGENGCATRGDLTILRLPGIHPRFEIIAPLPTARKLWESLKAEATMTGPGVWAWLGIMAGVPVVLPPTSEAFVPQMANLELIGGVNFKKGCYPGQEIVARMQYLGKLKQRMYRAHVTTDTAPQPGDAVYAPDFPNQSAGTVVDARPSPEAGYDLLAVIQISSTNTGELHIASETGPRLSLQPLPYSISTAA